MQVRFFGCSIELVIMALAVVAIARLAVIERACPILSTDAEGRPTVPFDILSGSGAHRGSAHPK